jgi:hypothetical protein
VHDAAAIPHELLLLRLPLLLLLIKHSDTVVAAVAAGAVGAVGTAAGGCLVRQNKAACVSGHPCIKTTVAGV